MILDRKQAPEFRAIEHISLIKPQAKLLPNGCNIFYFDSGDQDLVRIEWIFGNQRFEPSKPLLNIAANTMLLEGTKSLTSAQIADKIDFYGAFLQADYGYDQSNLTLYSLNKHLGNTLPVVKDILEHSVFPESELETFIRNQLQKLQVNLRKNDILARRSFNKALFGNTLYGLAAEPENYKSLNRADLQQLFSQMYQPCNCTIIVAGKITPASAMLIEETFGNWDNYQVHPDTTQPPVENAAELLYYIEKPEALQSAIRMGSPAINRCHPDFPALQVLITVLGGYFGSRLMTNIREDKGYTYGIGAGTSSLKHAGSLFIATEVGADVCKAAMTEVEKELKRLQDELIPEDELSLVRNFLMGAFLGSLENVFSHADKFKSLYFSGLDYGYYDLYTETVKSVGAARLQELAQRYLNFDEFYKVIVGKY